MFDVAVSQLTTPRWDLAQDLAAVVEHGLGALSLWRPKLSDTGLEAVAASLVGEAHGDLDQARQAAATGLEDVQHLLLNHAEAIR